MLLPRKRQPGLMKIDDIERGAEMKTKYTFSTGWFIAIPRASYFRSEFPSLLPGIGIFKLVVKRFILMYHRGNVVDVDAASLSSYNVMGVIRNNPGKKNRKKKPEDLKARKNK